MSASEAESANSASIVPAGGAGITKRSFQVKVTLNHAELELLDHYVDQLGSDRSSTFRHLLHLFSNGTVDSGNSGGDDGAERSQLTTSLDLASHSHKGGNERIVVIEPAEFQDGKVRQALNCIANNTPVILGLLMMDSDQAQRAVDYLAGATEALKGHCERIAESTFLFTPSGIPIEVSDSNPSSSVDQIEGRHSIPPLLGGSPE
jgi:hypothetical protein